MARSDSSKPTAVHSGKALVALLALTLCSNLATAEVRSVEGLRFSKVLLVGGNQLEIRPGQISELRYRGAERNLEPPPFVLDGDTLRLGVTAEGKEIDGIQYKLAVTQLDGLRVTGSGEAFVKPLDSGRLLVSLDGSGAIRLYGLTATELELQLAGSGELQAARVESQTTRLQVNGSGDIQVGQLQTALLKVHLAGSGDITLESDSHAASLEIGLLGSGDVSMAKLSADDADVTIIGSGDIEIGVLDQLEAEILGSGDLSYRGNPAISTSILGSGEVRRRD